MHTRSASTFAGKVGYAGFWCVALTAALWLPGCIDGGAIRTPGGSISTITGSSEDGSQSSTLESLTLVAPPGDLYSGSSFQLEAVGTYEDGSSGVEDGVTWSSSNSDVAAVEPGGLLNAVSPGVVEIEGQKGSVTSEVLVVTVLEASASDDSESDDSESDEPEVPSSAYVISLREQITDSSYDDLDGQTINGEVFIALDPSAGAETVTFYLDDPAMTGEPHRVELNAPFDFTSGAMQTGSYEPRELPWDSSTVPDGAHSITALVELASGGQVTAHADFTVSHPTVLAFSDHDLTFRHELEALTTEQSSVTLSITDDSTADFTLAVADANWLTVSADSDSVPATITIEVDSTVGVEGSNHASVTASVDGFEDAVLNVTLRVSSGSADTDLVDSVTRHDITWNFDDVYEVGQFANGDYFVVGPVTLTGSSPSKSGDYDGSMINPVYGVKQGYDGRFRHSSSLGVDTVDLTLEPGDSLVTVDSWRDGEAGGPTVNKSTNLPRPAFRTAAVLTCVAEVPPAGSFRPPYGGDDKPIHSVDDIRWELLPKLDKPSGTPAMSVIEDDFERVWLDHISQWMNRYMHPSKNMPDYSRNIASTFNTGSLMLMLDFSDEEKETLLIRLLQIGIDQMAILKSGANWGDGGGGIGSGRKWPILLAGIMLDDQEMMDIGEDYGVSTALEDCQTFFLTAADAANYPDKNIGDAVWGERHCTGYPAGYDDPGNKGYRKCCTANAWVGAVLSVHILTGETGIDVVDMWNHPALFEYQDDYMDDVDSGWMRSFSSFQEKMWDQYRDDYDGVVSP